MIDSDIPIENPASTSSNLSGSQSTTKAENQVCSLSSRSPSATLSPPLASSLPSASSSNLSQLSDDDDDDDDDLNRKSCIINEIEEEESNVSIYAQEEIQITRIDPFASTSSNKHDSLTNSNNSTLHPYTENVTKPTIPEDSMSKENPSYLKEKEAFIELNPLKTEYTSLTKITITPCSEVDKPKDSAHEEDIYELSCRKIQSWWRIKQLNRHFHKIKHRPSASVNGSTNIPRPSHSRKNSEEYPLKHVNNEYVQKFNEDPVIAVKEMLAKPLAGVSEPHEIIATFLVLNEAHLDQTSLGDLFGQPDPIYQDIFRSYLNSIHFEGIHEFPAALRLVLSKFRLPGEAQKITRILEAFANRYCFVNPTILQDATTAFVLAFSLIMLNTDAHNPAVKKKMTLPEFLKNNRGIDNGKDLPQSFLTRLFFDIKCCPIRLPEHEDQSTFLQKLSNYDEVSKSKYIAEFSAWKAIKNNKHPRHLFLFKDKLLVTKIRPGPKYILNHSFDLGNLKIEKTGVGKKSVEGSDNVSLNNLITMNTLFPRPESSENEKEVTDQITLGFDYSEELSVFWDLVHRQKHELEEERRAFQESLPLFVANRVHLTKSQIESSPTRRYDGSSGSLRATRVSLQKTASHVNQSLKQSKSLIQTTHSLTTPRPSSQQGYLSSLPKRLGSFIGVFPNSSSGETSDHEN